LLNGLAAQLASSDAATRERTALAWWDWERWLADPAIDSAADLVDDARADPASAGPDPAALLQRYCIQAHYLRHGCWLNEPDLLARCDRLPQVSTLLLHGTGDRICPPAGATALAGRLPHAHLCWVAGAGHDPTQPAMIDAMVHATQLYAQTGALHR
jgi:proline iminopeptidase